MNPWLLLGWVASVLGAGYWAYGAGQDKELATQAREDKAATLAREAAARAAADAISKITVKHTTIKQELEHDIQTREVYRRVECDTGPDSLQRFNAGIPGHAPAGASAVSAEDAGH